MTSADFHRRQQLIADHMHNIEAILTWGADGCQLDDCAYCGPNGERTRLRALQSMNQMRIATFRRVYA